MTVGLVTEMWSRYSATEESDDGVIKSFRGIRGFQVSHDAGDSAATILADSNLPQIADLWPGETAVFCRRRSIETIGPNFTQVICEFFGQTTQAQETIFTVEPKWTWSNSITNEPVDVDARGIPFTNSIGDVKEGFSKEVSDFTLTVERPFQSVNTYALAPYLDSVNLHPYGTPDGNIWPAGTASLVQFTANTEKNAGFAYYNVTARIEFRYPYLTIPARAWWYRYRNDGLNVVGTDYAAVTFSGGGALKQASGYVIVSGGAVTAVVVTDRGSGYTSAPTVTITGSPTGSGATATATVANGEVDSVTVTAGGSLYKNRIQRAVDANKEPESRPVLLKADGRREYNAAAAIFIERPKKQFILPYSGLGLF